MGDRVTKLLFKSQNSVRLPALGAGKRQSLGTGLAPSPEEEQANSTGVPKARQQDKTLDSL